MKRSFIKIYNSRQARSITMEAVLLKAWGLIQPYLSLLGGATLHVLFVKKIGDSNPNNETKKTITGIATLFAISILLGIFIEVLVVGYYSYNNLQATTEIRKAAWWLGAAIGFSGTVFLMKKLVTVSTKLFDAYVKWKFASKPRRDHDNYDGYDNRRDQYQNESDNEYQDR